MSNLCEIAREDLRPGARCPLCNQKIDTHANRVRLLNGVLEDAEAPRRGHRWMASNQATGRGLGNVSLIEAVRFAMANRRAGNGRTRIRRWGS
jgi:hypothetical protein